MKQHRHAKGTDAHVTADRSDGPSRRRKRKPIAEGGTQPHLGVCAACGGAVIHHRLAGGIVIVLDRDQLQHGDPGALYIIMFGFVIADPLQAAVPVDVPYHRAHVCSPLPAPEL